MSDGTLKIKMIECNCSPIVPNSHHEECPTYLAIVASIRELEQCDHQFLPKDVVDRITEPFGFTAHTYVAKANPQDFKGLSLWDKDGNPIDELRGQAAHNVASQICRIVGVDYAPMHGIGSQLRSCIDALNEFWGIKEEASSGTS